MHIKLGDFGLATKLTFDDERKRTVCGTPNYLAPEMLREKNGYSYQVDIWSLGIILYTLLIGSPPFETKDKNDARGVYKNIKANNYKFPSSVPISDEAKDLISKLLSNDPQARPSIKEVLKHPWIDNNRDHCPCCLPVSTLVRKPTHAQLKRQVAEERRKHDKERRRAPTQTASKGAKAEPEPSAPHTHGPEACPETPE